MSDLKRERIATPQRKGRGRVEDGRLTVRGGARASIVVNGHGGKGK
jgi:hypothetical protein